MALTVLRSALFEPSFQSIPAGAELTVCSKRELIIQLLVIVKVFTTAETIVYGKTIRNVVIGCSRMETSVA